MPPYQTPPDLRYPPPGYDSSSGLNTGNLGFMTLPVERTVGGTENNVFNPNVPFNPYTQGYFTGDKNAPTFNPYLPDKIVLGQRPSNSGPVGQATQTINGKQYNIGANNFEAGKTSAPQRPFEASAPAQASSMTADAPFTGYNFGEQGKTGYKFMGGQFDQGKFYANQPNQPKATPNLGMFQPWNPALNALQQSRSQP